ncbi:MAG: MarR family transcriptional regulator [Myxococcota bacterium]
MPPVTDRFIATLEEKKRQSTLQLLMKCARLVNEHALRQLPKMPGPAPRPAHTTLFPHIDHEGTRLTELAKRVGVTKQAVGQLVDDLVAMGIVERRPDPNDGRAKRVHFTRLGRRRMLQGLDHLLKVQDELDHALDGVLAELHPLLLPLHDHLVSQSEET